MAGEIPPGSPTRTAPPHPSSAAAPRAGHSDPPRTNAPDGLRQTTPSATRAPPALRYTHASSEFDSFAFARSCPITWGPFVFMQQSHSIHILNPVVFVIDSNCVIWIFLDNNFLPGF